MDTVTKKLMIKIRKRKLYGIKLTKNQEVLLKDAVYIHNRVETGLNHIISLHLSSPIHKSSIENIKKDALRHVRISQLASELSFIRKLTLLKKWKLLIPKQINLFTKLDTLRNDFAHLKRIKIEDNEEYFRLSYNTLNESAELIDVLLALAIAREKMAFSETAW